MKRPKTGGTPSTKSDRSQLMARISSKDTEPEMVVRRMLFAMGYRFRVHREDLPGCPDIAFFSRKKVIFVNGCFWHQHAGCPRATLPKTNEGYWLPKLEGNKQRDEKVIKELEHCDWMVLTLWECETLDEAQLQQRLKDFLGSPKSAPPKRSRAMAP